MREHSKAWLLLALLLMAVPAAAQDAGPLPALDAGTLPAATRVVIREASRGQPLQLWTDGGVVTHTLYLDEMGNAPVDNVRLRATGLRDESGVSGGPVELLDERDGGALGTVSLGALDSLPVRLRTSVDQPGTYRGRLTILHGGREQGSTDVVITWPRPALNVDVSDPAARVRGTTSPWPSEPSVRIPLTLRETAGLPVTLYPPVLTSLTLQEDAADTATAYQVPVTAKVLAEVDGGVVIMDAPFVLGRRQALPVQLALHSELPGAGLYRGKVRIGSAGAPPLDATFTLYLKESSWMAFVLILLGVLVSFGIRAYQTVERPRLVLEHRTQVLLQSLDDLAASPACDGAGRELVAHLREQVDMLRLGSSRRQVLVNLDALGAKLDVLERKVAAARNWVRLRGAVLALSPASLQQKPLDTLANVKRALSAPDTPAGEMEGLEATLRALPDELQTAVREHLTAGIQRLRDSVSAVERSAPTSRTMLLLTSRVVPSLDLASRELDRDVQATSRALDTARAAYATILADELTATLEAPAPAFVPAKEWSALQASVHELLTPLRAGPVVDTEAAVLAYEQALKHYLQVAGAALFAHAKGLAEAAGTPAATVTALEEVRAGAESAVRLAREGHLASAKDALEKARARYEAATAPVLESGGMMGEGTAPRVSLPTAPAGVSLEALPEALSQGLRLARAPVLEGRTPAEVMAWIGRRLVLSDLITLGITLTVASLVGLKLLWVDDPLWGGWGDWLVAFLWGFGLHMIAHPGLAPLIQRIIAPAQGTPPPATPAPPAGGT
jgi:hypothetical protein